MFRSLFLNKFIVSVFALVLIFSFSVIPAFATEVDYTGELVEATEPSESVFNEEQELIQDNTSTEATEASELSEIDPQSIENIELYLSYILGILIVIIVIVFFYWSYKFFAMFF